MKPGGGLSETRSRTGFVNILCLQSMQISITMIVLWDEFAKTLQNQTVLSYPYKILQEITLSYFH